MIDTITPPIPAPPGINLGSTRGLMALRSSAASFQSSLNVRSLAFERLCVCLALLSEKALTVGADLADELRLSVPSALSIEARRNLLRAKRAAYKGRVIPDRVLPHLPPAGGLVERAKRYNDLLIAKQELIEGRSSEVMDELRQNLRSIANDLQFQIAVDYSCPRLLSEYQHSKPADAGGFTDSERTIYSYAAKFISKANPFYTFAGITLSSEGRDWDGDRLEVVLDTSLVTAEERRQLSQPWAFDDNRLICFRSHASRGDSVRFLTREGSALRIVPVKVNELLREALRYCAASAPARSLNQSVAALSSRFPGLGSERIKRFLESLIRRDVLSEYLVKDFDSFEPALTARDQAMDGDIEIWQKHHLSIVAPGELATTHKELSRCRTDGGDRPGYYINLLKDVPLTAVRLMADRCVDELETVKPFFTFSHNFLARGTSVRRFLTECARKASPSGVAYLDVLETFLRDRIANNPHFSNAAATPAWIRAAQDEAGILSTQRASELLLTINPVSTSAERVCFNGPLDFQTGTFYPTNIFPGGGRYVSRYLLKHKSPRIEAKLCADHMDVQLVAPFPGNRTYVRSMFAAGCGFEARYRHRFQFWIDPSDVEIHLSQGGMMNYVHGPTGRSIRFHFFGFVLAEFLGPEYQLLLADHADFFHNPFRRDHGNLAWTEGVGRIPALHFGRICLRREEWIVARIALPAGLLKGPIVKGTLETRDWLHELTGSRCEEWYYCIPSEGNAPVRPRFLSLKNPLSMQVMRREVRRLGMGSRLALSQMEPRDGGLLSHNGETFASEAMIEV